MKTIKKILCLVLTLLTVTSLFIGTGVSADAANVCGMIKGTYGGKTVTLSIKTGNRLFGDKLVLTQTKGTARFRSWRNKDTQKSIYGDFYVRVDKISGGTKKSDHRTIEWRGKKNCTIKLQRNATYRISIESGFEGNLQVYNIFSGSFEGWKTKPYWTVKKTKGISTCG